MKFIYSTYDDDCTSPKTLGDWVKNFRIKKLQMKRKLRTGGDLRACAIMATALLSAENQLRRKQQERLSRCLQFQTKFHDKLGATSTSTAMAMTTSASNITEDEESPTDSDISHYHATSILDDEEFKRQSIEISNLWKDELNGLDEFMRKMSSSSGGGGNINNIIHSNYNESSSFQYGENGGENMSNGRAITVSS